MGMSPEAKAARAEYYRSWRKANPEKRKRSIESYWERKAAERAARDPQEGETE